MKRLFFAVFFAFIVLSLCAQARLGDFTMRGAVSQEMKADGLVGAHASFPLNSLVKITNPRNGREVEVTIVDRINPSENRIIDISPSAAQALGISAGEQVVLTVSTPQPSQLRAYEPIVDLVSSAPVTSSAQQSAPVSVSARETLQIVQPAQNEGRETILITQEQPVTQRKQNLQNPGGVSVEINNRTSEEPNKNPQDYNNVNNGNKDSNGFELASHLANANESTEFLAWLMAMSIDARDAREAREAREVREAREAREARDAREAREVRETRESREARETREAREARESREAVAVQNRVDRQVSNDSRRRENNQPAVRESQPAIHQPVSVPVREAPVPSYQEIIPQQPAPPPPVRQPVSQGATQPATTLLEEPGLPLSNARPIGTNINTLVPDLRVASNQSANIQPRSGSLPPVSPESVQIIPGLPDRSSGKNYRLQIGAYSAQDAAIRAANYIKSAGFAAEVDFSNSVFRVMAVGIPSVDVYSASIRLGALGFGQIWVRE
ncbi:MAG: SPOR domain-containing protein [Treponema sp.]|nr:SPOR domain-containing protein [Treponema sp.]